MSKILVADDSRFQVALLTKALQEKGFEVVVAQDAMQAGMVALRTAPDAIVLDTNMPGGSGIDVLKRLKRSTKTQRIPVVVVSGSGDSDIRQIALDLSVADFLTKPVDLDQVCRTLSSLMPVLPRRSTTHASEAAKPPVWRLNLQQRIFSNKTG